MIRERQRRLVEFAYFITPDGIEYPLFGGQRSIMSWDGIGMPEPAYITDRGPFQHGETVRDFRLDRRIVSLELYERGCGRPDFWCIPGQLIDRLRPNRSSTAASGTLRIYRPINENRPLQLTGIEIGARILRGPNGSWVGDERDYNRALRLLCEDPIWQDVSATEATFEPEVADSCLDYCLPQCVGSSVINDTTNITYCGTWNGDKITITITGPITGPTVTNSTTGKSIQLSYTVSAGETVTIDIQPDIVTVENNSGTNLIGTVTNVSDLVTFVLAAIGDLTSDGTNTIQVTGSGGTAGETAVTINYRQRFISAFPPCNDCGS